MGRRTHVVRSVTRLLTEQLRLAGDIGENVPRLLAAAEWFMEQGDVAQLRGRLVQSQLAGTSTAPASPAAELAIARGNLARAYDLIGVDGFNALYDTLIWEVEPRGYARRALFRAALHALAQILNAKKPR
jgi:hypothetical protein